MNSRNHRVRSPVHERSLAARTRPLGDFAAVFDKELPRPQSATRQKNLRGVGCGFVSRCLAYARRGTNP